MSNRGNDSLLYPFPKKQLAVKIYWCSARHVKYRTAAFKNEDVEPFIIFLSRLRTSFTLYSRL